MTTARLGGGWLFLILLLAAGLRGWQATSQSLWIDEVITARIATTPLVELWAPTPTTLVMPTSWLSPLYYLILKVWLWLPFADLDARLRWSSVTFGVCGVWAMARAAATLGGARIGRITGLLAALSPLHVWFSQEVRPYVLLATLATIGVEALHRGLDGGGRRVWFVFVVITIAAYYTHPIALSLPALALVHGVVERSWQRPAVARALGGALGAIAVGSVPGFVLMHTRGANFMADPRGPQVVDLLYVAYAHAVGFSLGPSASALHEDARSALHAAAPVIAVVAVVFGGLAAAGIVGLVRGGGTAVTRIIAWLSVPVLLLLVMAFATGNTLNVRYTLLVHPAILLLWAAGTDRLWRWRRGVAVVVVTGVLACLLVSRWQLARDSRYAKEDVRGMAAVLTNQVGARDIVLVNAPYMVDAVAYYLRVPIPIIRVPRRPGPASAEVLRTEARAAARDADRVWLVESRTFHGDRRGVLRTALTPEWRADETIVRTGVVATRFVPGDGRQEAR